MLAEIDLHGSKIMIGAGCLPGALAGAVMPEDSRLFVISQAPVWEPHGARFLGWVEEIRPRVEVFLVPDGEQAKNLAQLGRLLEWLADRNADRRSLIMVLGGGVVGDLAGFAAATYMRGISWIYVPTTLLAQQDASIGGKVGVNLPQGKNLVGHFWPPRTVMIDSVFLRTLPDRQLSAGYMEALKHGILDSQRLYGAMMALDLHGDHGVPDLAVLVEGLRVKARIVARDPLERDIRRLLNLGHTFGHALEAWSAFQMLHGEAVGYGMVFASLLANRLGSTHSWSALHADVVTRLGGLDTDGMTWRALRAYLSVDKKNTAGDLTWVVPMQPGKVDLVSSIAEADLETVFDQWKERVGR